MRISELSPLLLCREETEPENAKPPKLRHAVRDEIDPPSHP